MLPIDYVWLEILLNNLFSRSVYPTFGYGEVIMGQSIYHP